LRSPDGSVAFLQAQQRVRPSPEFVEAVQQFAGAGHMKRCPDEPKEKVKRGRPVGRQTEIERPEKDVEELRRLAGDDEADAELGAFAASRGASARLLHAFRTLAACAIARHPQRPYTLINIALLFNRFHRAARRPRYGDDKAIVAGLVQYRFAVIARAASSVGWPSNVGRNKACCHCVRDRYLQWRNYQRQSGRPMKLARPATIALSSPYLGPPCSSMKSVNNRAM